MNKPRRFFVSRIAHLRTRPYSAAPCAKCGEYKVTCVLKDESDGCGTYYDITCEACGDHYRVDGPDA